MQEPNAPASSPSNRQQSLVQRTLDGEGGGSSAASAPPQDNAQQDIDSLVDEVYTRLRWRLSAERERVSG